MIYCLLVFLAVVTNIKLYMSGNTVDKDNLLWAMTTTRLSPKELQPPQLKAAQQVRGWT